MSDRSVHPSAEVHPQAIVEDGASIGEGCRIGPFCHVGAEVVLGPSCELKSHVAVAGDTHLGEACRIFPFASIGHEPQDLKHAGEPVQLRIGARCTFREGVTINPGTAGDRTVTTIGDDGVFLANAHVAHDCRVGDRVIFSNNVMLAGHCEVGDGVIMGGGAAVHQFTRIGALSFVGGLAGVENDVIPFGMALGNRAYLGGVNIVGMRRAGLDRTSVRAVRNAVQTLFSKDHPVKENLARIRDDDMTAEVERIVAFVEAGGDRALCTPKA